jgi:ACT domain-containing protein
MAYSARKMNYCYITVNNRSGSGANILGELKAAGIDLQAFSGFPTGNGKAQMDLVADRLGGIQRLAKKKGWKLSKAKKGFLIQGSDEIGAVEKHLRKLANANINVTAADAVTAGKGRYGMILWVKRKDYNRAAKVLGA